jgi:hypothetical protein
MKLEGRLEAHDSLGHAFAGDNYLLFQDGGKVVTYIEPVIELCHDPSIKRPPKYLMVDSIFFQLRSTNYFESIRELADTL